MITAQDVDRLADILVTSPAWARLALSSTDKRVQARGADELSAFLLRRLAEPSIEKHPDQLSLSISV